MMSTSAQTIHNFSAGPCILPQSVMQQASDAVRELDGSGLSLVEISHRSKAFVDIMEEARSLVRSELNLPDHYEVLCSPPGSPPSALEAFKRQGWTTHSPGLDDPIPLRPCA